MIKNQGKKDWFFPFDFMDNGLGDLFVGYEASARLSELAKLFPAMIETKKNGKYLMRRFKFEELPKLFLTLSKDWKSFILGELNKYGAYYKIIERVPVINHEANSVRIVEKLVEVNVPKAEKLQVQTNLF